MLVHVASSCESLAAYLTEERFLSRMLPGMDNQMLIRYPAPTARITFKRTIVCVRHQMYREIVTLCRSVVALVAFIRQFTGMLIHVSSQVTFHCEPFITRLTDEWLLARMCSHVYSEAGAVCCRVIASVAFKRTIFSCSVFGQDVSSQV